MILDSRYEVLEDLGSGIWATVYKVRDLRTDNIYALKLFDQLNADEFYSKLPASDMHHITQIRHPNLADVVDFGNIGDNIYCIDEFYDGHVLTRFPISRDNINELYDIIVQICYALHALHEHNIIHKDIKPHNILFKFTGSGPQIKVLDYGFSKVDLTKETQQLTSSLPFVAPELFGGADPIPQTDFYSLGVTLYRLTTGAFPFSIKQIKSIIEGNKDYVLPKLPRQINSDIPELLEKFIIKLLEKDPHDRFKNVPEIIEYINKIQVRKYPFSYQWSTVNFLKFNSYFVNKEVSEKLYEYTDMLKNEDGKLITLMGGQGVGKRAILTLFKYKILTGKYFIFDYECSHKHNDPFYALTKEFHHSLKYNRENSVFDEDLTKISSKFKKFLFESEESAKLTSFSKEDMLEDFESIRSYLKHLSQERPLVFIIRQAELLNDNTIDFINYCIDTITTSNTLIILSFNNYMQVKKLNESVMVKVPFLNLEQTKQHIFELLKTDVPSEFINRIYERTAGNPQFIQEFLIELTKNGVIWDANGFHFDYDISDISLPNDVLHSIYARMSHLTDVNYKFLMDLSVIKTPLSKNLISKFLNIEGTVLFNFISDSLNNEILSKKGEFFYFTFPESQRRFLTECNENQLANLSKRIIAYFDNQEITIKEICQGVIENSLIANDYYAYRNYTLKLYEINIKNNDQISAFANLIEIIKTDLSDNIDLEEKFLIQDLRKFTDKIDLLCNQDQVDELIQLVSNYDDMFYKYLAIIKLLIIKEDLVSADKYYNLAKKYVITAVQKYELMIAEIKLLNFYGEFKKINDILAEVNIDNLTDKYKLLLGDRLAVNLFNNGKVTDAIDLVEKILNNIPILFDDTLILILANIHINLGTYYASIKMLTEAEKHYTKSITIYEKYNIEKLLVLIYNNIGDIYLRQGITQKAYEYLQKAYILLPRNFSTRIAELTYINLAEVKIKFGSFIDALEFLDKAEQVNSESTTSTTSPSIATNRALAMSKTSSFKDYVSFVYKYEASLEKLKFKKLTALVKTYFYFLYELSDSKKLEELLNQNSHIKYSKQKEEEFYYNVLNLIAVTKHNYEVAYRNIEYAKEYAKSTRNKYAFTIFKIREAECLIFLNKPKAAQEILNEIEQICLKYEYMYWHTVLKYQECRIMLLNPDVHLRVILRHLFAVKNTSTNRSYVILEIKVLALILQVLVHIGQFKRFAYYLQIYKKRIENITDFDNIDFYKSFLVKYKYFSENPHDFKFSSIAIRNQVTNKKINLRIAELLQIKDINKIVFSFGKLIESIAAPSSYLIATYNEDHNYLEEFATSNFEFTQINEEPYKKGIEKSFKQDQIINIKHLNKAIAFVPLKIINNRVGIVIIEDQANLPYVSKEIKLLRLLKLQLSTIMMRAIDFIDNHRKMTLMQRLMSVTHKLIGTHDFNQLSQEIVFEGISFLNASRGFFILIDEGENYRFLKAMDSDNNLIKQYTSFDMTALSKVQQLRQPLYSATLNQNRRFDSTNLGDFKQYLYYCAPIIIENKVFAIVYFDNFLDTSKKLYINRDIMKLFLFQVTVSVRNAVEYDTLFKKNVELVELDYMKNDFINIVSHELNTPLSKIKSNMRKLKSKLKKVNITNEQSFLDIENTLDKLTKTSNDIVTLNRYNIANSLPLNPIELDELVELIVQEASIIADKRHIALSYQIEKNLPHVMADWQSIEIMLNQIIMNAIRFTNDFGEILVGVRTSSFQKERIDNNSTVVLFVKDNGIGIPEKELENVFKMFYELTEIYAHKSGTFEYKSSGLGIGLATCKRIVDLNNGKIWINSKEHEGTTVFVSLPIINNTDDQN